MQKRLAVIGFGGTMIAIGVDGFILPLNLINGGFLGMSLLLNYLLSFHVGITFILLSLPVYLFAFKSDPIYFINGFIGAIFTGFMIELLMPIKGAIHLPIISSIILGAVINGIGVGVMLRNHISPGGMDLLALMIAKRSKVNVGVIMFAMDALCILTGLLLLEDMKLFYSLLIISITGLLASLITSSPNEQHHLK
jgi:uncharacterized membrane-anchored protein YitT (DUF2179 family)